MKKLLPVLSLAMLPVALNSTLAAQSSPPLERGARVRITAANSGLQQAVGVVRELDDTALVVSFERPTRTMTVKLGAIDSMSISVKRRPRGRRGAALGLLVGGAIGAGLGFASGDDPPCGSTGTIADIIAVPVCDAMRMSAGQKAMLGGVALGVAGAVTGFVVGRLVKSDVWTPFTHSGDFVQVSPVLGSRELGIGLTIPF